MNPIAGAWLTAKCWRNGWCEGQPPQLMSEVARVKAAQQFHSWVKGLLCLIFGGATRMFSKAAASFSLSWAAHPHQYLLYVATL